MEFKIMVVDDEPMICKLLDRYFTSRGYEVLTAGNGHEAVRCLSETNVDVVVTDLVMPKMNGIELLQWLKVNAPMVHSIALTGHATLEGALDCMSLGADTIVFKPLEQLSELGEAVKIAEERKRRWQDKLDELRGIGSGA